jgi:hypothetical protein
LYPFTFKLHVIIPYGWIKLHCLYILYFLDPFISCRISRFFLLPAIMNGCTNLPSHWQCIRFLFRHILISICCYGHIHGHSNWGEMKSQCVFDFHLLYNQRSWTLLHVFTGQLRIPCLIHVPISSLGCWFLGGWFFLAFIIYLFIFSFIVSTVLSGSSNSS